MCSGTDCLSGTYTILQVLTNWLIIMSTYRTEGMSAQTYSRRVRWLCWLACTTQTSSTWPNTSTLSRGHSEKVVYWSSVFDPVAPGLDLRKWTWRLQLLDDHLWRHRWCGGSRPSTGVGRHSRKWQEGLEGGLKTTTTFWGSYFNQFFVIKTEAGIQKAGQSYKTVSLCIGVGNTSDRNPPKGGRGDFWCLPPVWNLRVVSVWSLAYISPLLCFCLVLLLFLSCLFLLLSHSPDLFFPKPPFPKSRIFCEAPFFWSG